MKYATLAMVATAAAVASAPAASAPAASTPAAFVPVEAHVAECAPLTANQVKALHVANLTKDTRDAALSVYSGYETVDATKTAAAEVALKLCYTTNHIAPTDQTAPTASTASTDKCAAKWNTWETAVNNEW